MAVRADKELFRRCMKVYTCVFGTLMLLALGGALGMSQRDGAALTLDRSSGVACWIEHDQVVCGDAANRADKSSGTFPISLAPEYERNHPARPTLP